MLRYKLILNLHLISEIKVVTGEKRAKSLYSSLKPSFYSCFDKV